MTTDNVQHIRDLLNTHTERLHKLELRAAQLGLEADPSVLTEIESIKRQIAELTQRTNLGSSARDNADVKDIGTKIDQIDDSISNQGPRQANMLPSNYVVILSVVVILLVASYILINVLTSRIG